MGRHWQRHTAVPHRRRLPFSFNSLLGCMRTRAQPSATMPGPGREYSPRCLLWLVRAAGIAVAVAVAVGLPRGPTYNLPYV
eukprot:scaffold29803_cov107-Isochrysis_galbana.AAC.6